MPRDIYAATVAAMRADPGLRGKRDSGRYANFVRVRTPQGSCFDGQTGYVDRVEAHAVFVRLKDGTLPFGRGELEVLR